MNSYHCQGCGFQTCDEILYRGHACALHAPEPTNQTPRPFVILSREVVENLVNQLKHYSTVSNSELISRLEAALK